MKTILLLTGILAASPLSATTFSQRTIAENLVNEISGPTVLQNSVQEALEPFVRQLRRDGMPEDLITQIRSAFLEWLEQDIVWEEISPALVDVYAKQFSEPELQQILDFVQTPTGKKFLTTLSTINEESTKLLEDYTKSKQPQLLERFNPIIKTYEAKLAAEAAKSDEVD